ncbi:MAG: hypothetical protein H8M99_06025, partial [Gloeobacteraceae cyanobacterium ES-bin-144]|nr:hypothetical protein [Verrucomicrobiales bacterium]
MTKPILLLAAHALALSGFTSAQSLDTAEVRLPYGELKQLLTQADSRNKPKTPNATLLSARLSLSLENDRPVINATFRTASFNNEITLIPLIAGDVSLEKTEPTDAAIVSDAKALCLANDKPGTRTLQLRLLPIQREKKFTFSIPPCPSVIFETGNLPADQSVVLSSDNKEETLAANQIRPLSNTGQTITIHLLDSRETREALRPPEPSTWTWQNQALVKPSDSDLIYHVIARASAANGSGTEALLTLPPEAQDVSVTGDDLISQTKVRGENRSLTLSLLWKTRGILDRQIAVFYRMPLRPLDQSWHLQAPGGEATRTRFLIANTPLLAYSADGLSAPLLPQGLPSALAEVMQGSTYQYLEA